MRKLKYANSTGAARQTMTNQQGDVVARIDSRFMIRPGKDEK